MTIWLMSPLASLMHIVKDYGSAGHFIRDHLKVLVNAVLGSLVVVRGNEEQPVCSVRGDFL